MNLKQTVYFMGLVGAVAGLASWNVQVWLSDFIIGRQEATWLLVATPAILMGIFIGGLTVWFADHWTSDRVAPSWVLMGIVLGALAGFITSLLYIPIDTRIIRPNESLAATRAGVALPWMIEGGLIGLVTGLRWVRANALRALHALLGGLVGGTLGGLVVAVLPSQEFLQALAYMVTGTGITLGVTLAPVLLSDGVLVFVSSGDPRAQNKYASPRQQWLVQEGDRLVIGSQATSMNPAVYGRDVQVYVPDAMIGARHAVLFARKKRFFIQLHPDNAGPHGQPLDPLQVGDVNVVGTRELHDGDELVVGQTLLRFTTRRKPASYEAFSERRP